MKRFSYSLALLLILLCSVYPAYADGLDGLEVVIFLIVPIACVLALGIPVPIIIGIDQGANKFLPFLIFLAGMIDMIVVVISASMLSSKSLYRSIAPGVYLLASISCLLLAVTAWVGIKGLKKAFS